MGTDRQFDPKPFVYLAIGLALWWLLPGFVRAFVKETFYEFQAPLIVAQSKAEDLRKFWGLKAGASKNELIEAGRDMARVNAALALRIAELEGIAAENRRFERLYALPSRPAFQTIVARVARRDLNAWWQQLTLRKGSMDGVKEGCPVVIAEGIIGRVKKVRAYTCDVELVTSPSFRISANIDGDDRPAIYQGSTQNIPFGTPAGNITHIPSDYAFASSPENPIHVFSSGFGGVFPGGINLGTVTAPLKATPDGLFLEGRVAIFPEIAALEEAAVLVPVGGDQRCETDTHLQ